MLPGGYSALAERIDSWPFGRYYRRIAAMLVENWIIGVIGGVTGISTKSVAIADLRQSRETRPLVTILN